MDNRYYENVINEMQPFLDEQGFTLQEDGSFLNAKKSVKINYAEERQMYTMSVADVAEDGAISDYSEVNAWLYDDTQNAKDAVAVGIDFVNSLRKELGVKIKRNVNADIDLPTASKSDTINITGFTKKMLDIFPVLKNDYKSHVAKYGNFLYLNFFGEFLVPQLKELFTTGTSKQVKKFYDFYKDAYAKGDRDTVNVAVALLCAASFENETAVSSIREMLKDNQHFLMSYNNFIPAFAKNKKLKKALLK